MCSTQSGGTPVFYFDFISPYAYLAWTKLADIEQHHKLRFALQPVLFAGLLNEFGQLGPAEIAPKSHWMRRNIQRKAARHKIPLRPPHSHPFNPLLALRVVCAFGADYDTRQLIDTLFRATWAEQRDISNPAVVGELLDDLKLESANLIEQASSSAIKRKLAENTANAAEIGVFGVPMFQIDGELFWGFDDIPFVENVLRGNDSLSETDLVEWQKVTATAIR